eukprot:gene10459-11558_t
MVSYCKRWLRNSRGNGRKLEVRHADGKHMLRHNFFTIRVAKSGTSTQRSSLGKELDDFKNKNCISCSSSRSVRPSEQRQLLHAVVPNQIKESWTHDFGCLQFKKQQSTPSATQLEMLTQAGYGRTKIQFEDSTASHESVCEKLESTSPSLKAVGGYTLWRAKEGGLNRPLEELLCEWKQNLIRQDLLNLLKKCLTSVEVDSYDQHQCER